MNYRYYLIMLLGISLLYCPYIKTEPDDEKETVCMSPEKFEELTYNWSRTFAEVLQLTDQKHYKVCDLERCMIDALNGFLNRLDPHSCLWDPSTYKSMMESTTGEFFGIGIVIDNTRSSKDRYLTVVEIIPDGPAYKAGVKPFDKIVEIDGTLIEGLSTEKATLKIKGPRNSKVNIKIMREGATELISFDIARDVVKEQNSLCFYLEDQNIYYLSLTMFSENSVKQLEQLLKTMQQKKCRSLILDLRNNSGGLLNAAVDIAGLFLQKGSLVVTTKNKQGVETERYETTRNKPIVTSGYVTIVLTNGYSASASEILAGCLKSHAEEASSKKKKTNNPFIFLVGSKTFGKGSVQEVIPISNNCAAKITTALYFLPGDLSIQGVGITPDFEIDRQFPPTEQQLWFNKHYGKENALHNYIKIHPEEKKEETKSDKTKTWQERAQAILETDNQFREAINLINIFNMGRKCCPHSVATRSSALAFLNEVHLTDKKLKFTPINV